MDDDGFQNHDHEVCLGLGLGVGFTPKRDRPAKNKRVVFLDLSFPLKDHENARGCNNNGIKEDDDEYGGDPTNCSNGLSRKKLRLTADQTTLLEDSFRNHTTLHTAQKMTLAEKLNLKPRQVEVWFQNRRARTKLKQIEEEYEMVKKTSERLREENRRLKKELLEARSSSSSAAAAIRFLECGKSKLVLEKLGVHRGGGKKAAGGVEVVHGGIGGLPKPNHEEQQTLGFVGEGKLKGE